MFTGLMNRLGDRNPQLLRELKGHRRWRHIFIAVGVSLIAQLLMLLFFMGELPTPFNNNQQILISTTVPKIDFHFDYQLNGSHPPRQGLLIENVFGTNVIESDWPSPQVGDFITAIDGQPITSFKGDPVEVQREIQIAINGTGRRYHPLDQTITVDLRIERNGQIFEVKMPRTVVIDYYNPYCKTPVPTRHYIRNYANNCMLEPGSRRYQIVWSHWHRDFFRTVSLAVAVALPSAASFLLIQNISREQHQGTLNFLRLSPRSAFNILFGKILGTPILVYLAIALCIPLHITLGILSGFTPSTLVIYYGFLLINSGFFLSLALLYGLLSWRLGGFQSWLYSGVLLGFQFILGQQSISDYSSYGGFQSWLALFSPMTALHYSLHLATDLKPQDTLSSIGNQLPFWLFGILFAVNGLVWVLWVWHGLHHKFMNPKAPLINRSLSYLLTFCFEIFLLGFATQNLETKVDQGSTLFVIAVLNLLFFSILIAMLQPTSQTLADWARFRHTQPKHQRTNRWQDWLLCNQSPPIIAVAVNSTLALGLISTWVVLTEIGNLLIIGESP